MPKKFVGEPFCVSKEFRYRKVSSKRGGSFTVLWKIFLSHRTETKSFVKEPFCFPEIFWYRKKIHGSEGAYHVFQSKFSCLTVPKNFVRESYCFWENWWFRKILWMKRRGITFSVEKTWSHSAEKIRWGTLRCIRKIRVARNLMHQRDGGYQVSSSKTFCHTVPKNFVWERFGVSEMFVHRKILCIGKGISLNSFEKSFSHSADKIRRRTLLGSERFLVSKSFKQTSGKLHGFVENFFISQDWRTSPGNHSAFQKISGWEKYFMDKGGVSRFSVEIFISLYRKISLVNTLVFQKNSFTENFHA